MLTTSQDILDQMIRYAEKQYPLEACGLLIGEKGSDSAMKFIPCRNIYNDMKKKDPETYTRDGRTAYLIDPKEQQQVFDQAEKSGREVKGIFHSHPDHGAYFSKEDRLIATPWGEPMYPGLSYIVASIYDKKLKEMNEFTWNNDKKDFIERKIM